MSSSSWHATAEIIAGPASDLDELLQYLRSGRKPDDEPPRKRPRNAASKSTTGDSKLHQETVRFGSTSKKLNVDAPADLIIQRVKRSRGGSLDLFLTSAYAAEENTSSTPVHLGISGNSSDEIATHLEDIALLSPQLNGQRSHAWSRSTIESYDHSKRVALVRTQIHWVAGRSWQDARISNRLDVMLDKYLPSQDQEIASSWTPKDFYDNLHVPPADSISSVQIDDTGMVSSLYPFQKRAVHWMIQREGANLQNGVFRAHQMPDTNHFELPPSFRISRDALGHDLYISEVHRVILNHTESLESYRPSLRGGILAEEMGLGKTVELIALAALHKQPSHLSAEISDGLPQSPATLIITPHHILQQWKNEIHVHAPNLKVFHYQGLSGQRSMHAASHRHGISTDDDDLLRQLLASDIVLTTYGVLSREIYFAEDPPDRSMRHARKYRRRRSPLVQTKWWRVCLDEAQMVESGVSNAATVARLIPRSNAWAVSGTPLRKNIEDLHGLLIFLSYEPFAQAKKLWRRIDKATLKQIFGSIGLRHNKHKVAHELRLPPQRRVVITMPFTTIEDQNYESLYQQMCASIHVSDDGSPMAPDWNPDVYVEQMRTWLRRLRETCLHPNVGAQNRRALGRGSGPLRTVAEVLESITDQNYTELRAQERASVLAQVLRGQIVNNDKSNAKRSQDALQIYRAAWEQARVIVEDCRAQVAIEKAKDNAEKNTKQAQDKRSDKKLNAGQASEEDKDVDDDDDDGHQGTNVRLATAKIQLRSALEALHICKFYIATSYYQMKEIQQAGDGPDDSSEFRQLEELEVQNYDEAKAIRHELLRPSQREALEAMQKVQESNKRSVISMVPILDYSAGIENRKILEKFDRLSGNLDAQTTLINELRAKIADILLRPLVDTDEDQEVTGEEYEDSTKMQDELYVYMAILRAVISDRQRLISGEDNYLVETELRRYKKEAQAGKGHAPEILLRLAAERDKARPQPENGSIQAVISEARSVLSALTSTSSSRDAAEAAIIKQQIKGMSESAAVLRETIKTLEKEKNLYHACMNKRLSFYASLQAISDMVAPWREELDDVLDQSALRTQLDLEKKLGARLAVLTTKRRFLLHLRSESGEQRESPICVICTDKFENGVLTVCGHQYCKHCITQWFRSHRTCPECRRAITLNDLHDISYKPQVLQAKEEDEPSSSASSPSRGSLSVKTLSNSSIYSDISTQTLMEIRSVDLDGSFGTKIDTICRHLLWLRQTDPGAKSLIFSQYSDFLTTLSSALKHFRISSASIREPKGIEKFRSDASRECFLLDAKSDSSGLNLVNATHVFLCEPLINAAIELQAIARVHRIGQLRETTVYMYLIQDTVEEAIYEISANRRLAHISGSTKSASAGTSEAQTPAAIGETALDKANNLEVQAAPINTLLSKSKKDGEIVGRDDLWSCLFGKPRTRNGVVSGALQAEVDRQLRIDAAEMRMLSSAG